MHHLSFPLLPFPYEHAVPFSHMATIQLGALVVLAGLIMFSIIALALLDRERSDLDDLKIGVRIELSFMAAGVMIVLLGAWVWIALYVCIATAILFVFGNAIYRTFAPTPKEKKSFPNSRVRFI